MLLQMKETLQAKEALLQANKKGKFLGEKKHD